MSRQARILAILAGMALIAVIALGAMARRYARLIDARVARQARPAAARSLGATEVESFIAVRRSMRLALDAAEDRPLDATRLAAVRDRALAVLGLPAERYAALRDGYRRWLEGRLTDAALEAAFEARRTRLEAVALGDYESLDGGGMPAAPRPRSSRSTPASRRSTRPRRTTSETT